MNPDPAPLIHVGFHRSASTWLQTSVFTATSGGFGDQVARGAILRTLIEPPGPSFDPAGARAAFAPLLEAAARPRPQSTARRVPIVSSERLTGYPHAGGRDAGELATRLAATFPGGRVLLVIREQRAVSVSCYRLYVKVGGALPASRYFSPPGRSTTRIPGFDSRQFDYHHIIAHYQRLFGADRVLVVPFEQLVVAPLEVVGRIADFAGAERPSEIDPVARNAGLRGLALAAKRRINRYAIRHSLNPYGRSSRPELNESLLRAVRRLDRVPGPAGRRVEAAIAAAVDESVARRRAEIAASNRQTSELLGLDLGDLGYLT